MWTLVLLIVFSSIVLFARPPMGTVYLLFVGVSLLLGLTAWTSLVWMLHAWRNADSLGETRLETDDLEPRQSFSLIIPARHEETVLEATLLRLLASDHPAFELLVVVGHDDPATREVAERVAARHPEQVQVIVDTNLQKNKPKALNTALPYCTGTVTGVFDAEDDVHPALLRRVDQCFQRTQADVVQAGVQLMNFRSSWLAVRNVLEYYFWFRSRLHFHARQGFIPLGGNTVFVRTQTLRAVGGWDPDCLAEDCELGVRLSSLGARTVVVYEPELVTREECPPTLAAFTRQRTRWNQGFLQTLSKGYWRRLPARQQMLGVYTLSMPYLLALAWLLIPIAVATTVAVREPVQVSLLTFVPVLPLLSILAVEIVGLGDFCRAYNERASMRDYARLALGLLLYQCVLAFAATRAVVREVRGVRGWEKTAHLGQHIARPPRDDGAAESMIDGPWSRAYKGLHVVHHERSPVLPDGKSAWPSPVQPAGSLSHSLKVLQLRDTLASLDQTLARARSTLIGHGSCSSTPIGSSEAVKSGFGPAAPTLPRPSAVPLGIYAAQRNFLNEFVATLGSAAVVGPVGVEQNSSWGVEGRWGRLVALPRPSPGRHSGVECDGEGPDENRAPPLRSRLLGALDAQLTALYLLLRRIVAPRADLAVQLLLLSVVVAVQGTNMLHWPGVSFDEGTYVGQAWAVQAHGALAPYTYSYGHPPLAWIIMSLWTRTTGIFGYVYSIDGERELMLAVTIVTCSLLYALARRLGMGRTSSAAAVLLFALNPIALYFHRLVLLDNIAIAWVLGAFVLALTPQRRLWAFAGSGACFAAGALSKETTLVLLPALLLAAVQNTDRLSRRYCLALFASFFGLIALAYPLYATLKGELLPGPGHVSLVGEEIIQLFTRKGTGNVLDPGSLAHGIVTFWLQLDPWLLGAALLLSPLALARRPTRAVALAFLIQVAIIFRPGYLPNMYVIGLVPFAALIVAASGEALWRTHVRAWRGANGHLAVWQVLPGRGKRRVILAIWQLLPGRARWRVITIWASVCATYVAIAASGVAVALALPGWAQTARDATTVKLDGPERAAQNWLVHNVGHDKRLIVGDEFWIYLIQRGFDASPVAGGFYSRTVVSYWPLDYDPAVHNRFPDGWRDFDYIVSTEAMRDSLEYTPTAADALQHSRVVVSFGQGTNLIEIREITPAPPIATVAHVVSGGNAATPP